ncbi:MAG: cation:proton antiporter, partial [bacterium]
LLGGAVLALGLPWRTALAVGVILALSSTAIALQSLKEKGMLETGGGQAAFSVLLFQDIAVIPILALFPLLAVAGGLAAGAGGEAGAHAAGATLGGWRQGLAVAGIIAAIVLGGRFLLRPIFRFVAEARLREIFTASALLLVVGVALAMQQVGLSPALGTFLAGVVLADNEYRHELEADIEPFKGLLLGLFFISVGASIDFGLLAEKTMLLLSLVIGLAFLKFAVLYLIGLGFHQPRSERFLFSFALAQGGEFAFVLVAFAVQHGVLADVVARPLVVVVALSMALAPLLLIVNEKLIQPRLAQPGEAREADEIDERENPVVLAGFGRFGQVVGRLLMANGIRVTVLDHDAAQIDMIRKFGFKVFYGDASRLDLLRAAGAAQARLLVLAIDDPDKTLQIAAEAREHFPNLHILARARGRMDAFDLINLGVETIQRETFASAVSLGVAALRRLGFRAYQAVRAGRAFQLHDEAFMHKMAAHRHDQKRLIFASAQMREELERMLQTDLKDHAGHTDGAWDAMPPGSD